MKPSPLKGLLLPLALLAAASVLFFWPLISLRQTYYQEDFGSIILPYFHWLHGHYKAGTFPSWSQGILCGYPYYDEGLTGVFYPPLRLILTWLDAVPGLAALYIVHVFWMAAGLLLLARSHGLSTAAALLAALAGAFGGGTVAALHSWVVLVSLAWMPWMMLGLWLCQGESSRERLAGSAVLGFSVGMSFLGGHVGFLLYECLVLAVLQAAWLVQGGVSLRRMGRTALALLPAVIVALLLSIGQAQAVARYAAVSVRDQAFSYAQASANSLSPASLLHMLFPYVFGANDDASFLGMSWRYGSWLHQGMLPYLGIPVFLLALIGIVRSPKSSWPFAAAALLMALYALGPATPVHGFFFKLPVFSHLRAPMKAIGLISALLALPAAWGFEALQHDAALRKRLFKWVALFAAALAASALLMLALEGQLMARGAAYIKTMVQKSAIHLFPESYYMAKLSRWYQCLSWHLCLQAVFAALLAGLLFNWPRRVALLLGLALFAELYANGSRFHPVADRRIFEEVPPPAALIHEREKGRSEPFRVQSWGWSRWYAESFPEGRFGGDAKGEAKLHELLGGNLGMFWNLDMLRGYTPVGLKRIEESFGRAKDFEPGRVLDENTRLLLSMRSELDRAGLKYIVSSIELKADGFKRLNTGMPIVYENLKALPLARFQKPEQGKARFVRYEDNIWEIETESSRGGDLLLSRAAYPQVWQAAIDGKPARWDEDGLFIKIGAPAGKHLVSLEYKDPDYARARALNIAGWALALLLLILAIRKPAHA